GQKEGWISSRVRYATAAVEGSSSPVINTVGKANLMPLASNAFLIIAKALRRMTNCSPGRVALLDGADWVNCRAMSHTDVFMLSIATASREIEEITAEVAEWIERQRVQSASSPSTSRTPPRRC